METRNPDRPRGRPRKGSARYHECRLLSDRTHEARTLIDEIIARKGGGDRTRWRTWKFLREACGGEFDALNDGIFTAGIAALNSLLSTLPTRRAELAARIPATRKGGVFQHPYWWVTDSIRLRHRRRRTAAELAGDLDERRDDESMRIQLREFDEFEAAVQTFECDRNEAMRKQDPFALRRAEADFERAMRQLDHADQRATVFPSGLAANDPL